jgi:cyclophilin family peptidyl-prolyl cis-trans isomerase
MRVSVFDYGDMVFELFDDRAPRVTDHISQLAEADFYDGIIFHRVLDDFVIQGGDPTGSGAGGSSLGDFDDQFHVDLQHNRTGILSMAKTTDDTNDSQFFVTEGPQRHLDFNHSVFGQLVEGFAVLQAITEVPTDGGGRPLNDVVMESADIFVDDENGMLVLKAPEGASGEANIRVTVSDADGHSFERTFHVTVALDTVNGKPFLSDIPEIETTMDTPVSFQLVAHDVEGDPVVFDATKVGAEDYSVQIDDVTGQVNVTPPAGFVGRFQLEVRVGVVTTTGTVEYNDTQMVDIVVGG